jgi:hypothetical protein
MTDTWKVDSLSLASTCRCVLHFVHYFRCAVSAFQTDCRSLAPQSVAPLREPARLLERIRDIHCRWPCVRRALWNRTGYFWSNCVNTGGNNKRQPDLRCG